jgi:hypothetical protein
MATEKLYYALDSKEPVLNGRGKDIRRIYRVKYEIGGVEKEVNIVGCFILDAYKVFEEIFAMPYPQVTEISSIYFPDYKITQP